MHNSAEDQNLQQLGQEIEALVQRVESVADPALRADVLSLVQSVIDFHAAGVSRMLEIMAESGETGRQTIRNIAKDELASSVLLLHGLHPDDLEQRVRAAIEKFEASLRAHGASVQLVEVEGGVVRVRLEQAAQKSGCGSTAKALQHLVENAIYSAAPDVSSVEVENLAGAPEPLVQLQVNGMGAL